MSYNPYSLEGKTILVTGASSGIGRTTAIECSKMGASVIITARNEPRLQETLSMLSRNSSQKHQMMLADLTNEDEVNKLMASLPSLNGASLNAGIVKTIPIKFIKHQDFSDVLNVNMMSPIYLVQEFLKQKKFLTNASVVFTSSIGGVFVSTIGNTMYGVSKGGLNAFMKGFALEMASKGIRSNSVNPGFVETHILDAGTITEEDLNKNKILYPMGRYGRSEDIALAIVFLLSDASSWITGQTLVVDGGFTLR